MDTLKKVLIALDGKKALILTLVSIITPTLVAYNIIPANIGATIMIILSGLGYGAKVASDSILGKAVRQ